MWVAGVLGLGSAVGMSHVADPSILDRRTRLIAGIDEAKLPIRDLHIAGIEGKAGARILSRDPKGPSTRVINIPAGWRSAAPGAFTETTELFVLRGSVEVDGTALGRHGLVCLPAGAGVEMIGSPGGTLALLWLAAPIRFGEPDADAGDPALYDGAASPWEADAAADGVLRKQIGTCAGVTTSLVAMVHRTADMWQSHSADEECFVLDGEMSVAECEDGAVVSHSYRPGGYVYRPAGSWHGGPGAGTARTVVILHRTSADAATAERDECAEEDA